MSADQLSITLALLKRTLTECRDLYVSSGSLCALEYPHLIVGKGEDFVELMDDLHRGLVLKVYFIVSEADRIWSSAEREIAEVLFEHLWGKRLTGDELTAAARKSAADVPKLNLYSLIRPFDRIVPLRNRVGELETLVMRLANLVARADGQLADSEARVIKHLQSELHRHLRKVPIDEPTAHNEPNALSAQAIETLRTERDGISNRANSKSATTKKPAPPPKLPSLEESLAELDGLIGLELIKEEVRTLTNYLKLQQRRGKAGLPDADMSLHMVFTGNPGTGKTTVARIIGKIFGTMKILQKGHLVETDRSGLVAQFMGQTGPKTHAKVDEALDGVLFIDEAYSLVFQEGQDIYGQEAIQTLLKRAEDDRARLVVILAGYPDEIRELLKSNPGLSSRFNRILHFEDYTPLDMARIFAWLCDKNHYTLTPGARGKLMLGLTELHRRRDRHFGNGRTVRNLFEHAIRRMANRIAEIHDLSQDELMTIHSADIEFKDLPPEYKIDASDQGPWRFQVVCPRCSQICTARGSFLGQKVRCRKCQQEFQADWGEPIQSES
jgi:hypothetical protein